MKSYYKSKQECDLRNPEAVKVGFKFPDGSRVYRIFLKTEPSSELYNFVFSNDQCPINFELNLLQPNKKIDCSEESEISIQDVGIISPMLIYIIDIDA